MTGKRSKKMRRKNTSPSIARVDLIRYLENHPPRVRLSKLERNFEFNEKEVDKYIYYFQKVNDQFIGRIRKSTFKERHFLSKQKRSENASNYRALCFKYELYGFNVLGYSLDDLEEIKKRFGFTVPI